MIFSLVRNVLRIAMVPMYLNPLQGSLASTALAAGFSLGPTCMQVTRPEFLLWLDTIFQHT